MRIRIAFFSLLLFAFARPGAASDFHLGWNACLADGGLEDITVPCDQPGAPVVLYGSFELSQPARVLALNFRIDFFVEGATMPPFWNFKTSPTSTGCNPGLTLRSDPQGACPSAVTPFPGGTTALSYVIFPGTPFPFPGLTEGRIVGSIFQDLTTGIDLAAGQTYFAFALVLVSDAAIEAGGACAGCATPVNLLQPHQEMTNLRSRITLDLDGGGTVTIFPDHTCVTANGGFGACLPTPTRRSTWGLLKSMYR